MHRARVPPPRAGRPAPARSAPSRCSPPARATPELRSIAVGRSLIVENNYGYSNPSTTEEGRTTTPAMRGSTRPPRAAAIQLDEPPKAAAPSSVASLARDGHSMPIRRTRAKDDGRLVFHGNRFSDWADGLQQLGRHGSRLTNNNYAPVTLDADGTGLHRQPGGS